MSVKLISISKDAEKLIAYMARVSSNNQDNPNIKGLLKYCIKHGHWSIYEMCNMVIEINTTRAISSQIIRHRSFSFQEFSQRYAKVNDLPNVPHLRLQDHKNRQNSIDGVDEELKIELNKDIENLFNDINKVYYKLLENGIAKECARMVLPMCSPTKIYMSGSIRSWIHYLNVRCDESTQLEHLKIANEIKEIFKQELPIIYEAVFDYVKV
jgi:thymidylate synthase (FAD)